MENIQIISIEGNIGSGKSTLLNHLKQTYQKNENVIFLDEPIEEWQSIKSKDGINMLEKFYENQEKYAFAFQMMAYISRLSILKNTIQNIKSSNKKEKITIITERTLFTDKYVFEKMLYEDNKIEEVCHQIYLKWFDEFSKDYPINKIVYINATPEECYKRTHIRFRKGEEIIPLSYLQKCHQYHEEFIHTHKDGKKLIIDGNIDIDQNKNIVDEWKNNIAHFMNDLHS